MALKKLGVGVTIKDDDTKGGSGGSGMGRIAAAVKNFPTQTALGMLSLIAIDKVFYC